MGPKPTQVNAKCDVVMKLSVLGTRTDRHTHKGKPIHPHYAGCNNLRIRTIAGITFDKPIALTFDLFTLESMHAEVLP